MIYSIIGVYINSNVVYRCVCGIPRSFSPIKAFCRVAVECEESRGQFLFKSSKNGILHCTYEDGNKRVDWKEYETKLTLCSLHTWDESKKSPLWVCKHLKCQKAPSLWTWGVFYTFQTLTGIRNKMLEMRSLSTHSQIVSLVKPLIGAWKWANISRQGNSFTKLVSFFCARSFFSAIFLISVVLSFFDFTISVFSFHFCGL